MKNVHILPEEIISKIAAGEVIERPASVIKELMENSLDAQASSIEVHLKEAGKTLIQIKDTGFGIEREDLETIFHRHSTSKIKTLDDLDNINSLGFRGEALYSIAAISDVILKSRTKNQDTGWEIHMRGGKRLSLKPVSIPVGTQIDIQELFFNTPARRKFLRSNTTELNQILNIFIPYALLHKQCRFLLTHQDKTLIDLAPAESLVSRLAQTLNLEEKHMIEAQHTFDDGISVHMVLGDINLARNKKDMQFIFVNNRPVQSKNISFHFNSVYRLILPPNHFPFFVAYITIPASDTDVNIHPTKREVKIRQETQVCNVVRHMCEQALMSSGQAKEVKMPSVEIIATVVERALSDSTSAEKGWDDEIPYETPPSTTSEIMKSPTEQYAFPSSISFSDVEETFVVKKQDGLKDKLLRGRYVGNFAKKYLLFEIAETLLVIDQHAAQERITFEKLILQMEKGQMEVQNLLSPILVRLSRQEFLCYADAQTNLEELGFSTTQWDKETIALHSYPILIKNPENAVREILSQGKIARNDHESLARRACRASVMAGDPLTKEQAEFERSQLISCRDPFTCPHGRPTVIEVPLPFLDKQFLRT